MNNAAKNIENELLLNEEHFEIINGVKIIKSGTSPLHNEIIDKLGITISLFIMESGKNCKIYRETVGLFCDEILENTNNNYFMPDVMVICDYDKKDVQDNGIHTTPKFVCEVTSPSTFMNDFNIKREIYHLMGVNEYWIIDLVRKCVFVYRLEDNYYGQVYSLTEPVTISECNLQVDFSSII